jgi:hypothetical protein
MQLDIAYGTDGFLSGKGFWFDKVTVTNIELLVEDTETNTCPVPSDESCFVIKSSTDKIATFCL